MSSLIIDQRNTQLEYASQCLIVRVPGLAPRSIPITAVQRIICLHNVALSTQVLAHCQAQGIDFVQHNHRHSEFSFALYANHQQQAQRRCRQYLLCQQPAKALLLARLLLRYKLQQAQRLLLQLDNHDHTTPLRQQLHGLRRQMAQCTTHDQLRGLEGSAQRLLFSHWQQQLPAELGFTRRQRRPAPDPVNAVLSLTYTLVYHEAIRQCLIHGLDPWLGIHHQHSHGRQSLACDVMEPIRCHVEAWVVARFNSGEFNRRQFSTHAGQCLFGKAGRAQFYPLWHAQQADWGKQMGRLAQRLARHLDHHPNQ